MRLLHLGFMLLPTDRPRARNSSWPARSPSGVSGSLQVMQRVRAGGDGLLEEPVEQQASLVGGAAVEPEGVLVEVLRQVLGVDAMVQGAGDPASNPARSPDVPRSHGSRHAKRGTAGTAMPLYGRLSALRLSP